MKAVTLVVLFSTFCLISGEGTTSAPPTTAGPAVDLAGAALSSFTEVTKQINQIQSVLSQLNGQLTKMVTMSTRLVTTGTTPAAADNSIPGLPNIAASTGGLTGSLFETFNRMTSQLTQIQNTIQQVTGQLQRVVETSTRMITGPALLYQEALPGTGNVIESILKTFQSWSAQLEQMNGVLRGMNKQWNRVIETGTRMITGSRSASHLYADGASGSSSGSGLPGLPGLPSGLPGVEQIQTFFSLLTSQFSAFQRVLTDLQSSLTRMVGFGGRPLAADATSSPSLSLPNASSPGDSVLAVVNTLTQQFQQIQKVLAELNQQMNRMIETGSKAMG